ncbi:hypothetical protein H3146_05950 [Streptomyces sp. OF3]|uniref:Uncharacterized protein n=1 Tax=Streptomyces alkaliterrae TaxID=2213162 RepID=A0A7W3ZLW9_9ACTN|nr:hypothetical protein [Streptomyces alkaliterrae]MBB1252910.1 hypothetical protein [Streptomyces alkaliterrae]
MGYLSDRLTGMRARREATRFEKTVRVGETYYSVEECQQPWGNELKVREWTFARKSRLTGQPMCGHMSAAGAWLNYGPLLASPPAHLKRLFETDGPLSEPDAKKLAALVEQAAKRQLAGA